MVWLRAFLVGILWVVLGIAGAMLALLLLMYLLSRVLTRSRK